MQTYLCFIEGAGARWQGVCVDFDLTVFGNSIENVKVKLGYAVSTYVADAMAEAEPDRSRLLNRRSPWTTRTRWRAHVALTRVAHKLGALAAATTIRLPAAPAAPCPV